MTEDDVAVPTADDLSVGDTGPEVVVEDLARRDFVKYAGASGDFNPIHYDEVLATDAGYESVFAQGMFTAGVAAQSVSHWFGVGNVRSYGVRFEAQVWPEDTVTAVAEVIDIEVADGNATVDLEIRATNEDGEIVLSGDASAEVPAE